MSHEACLVAVGASFAIWIFALAMAELHVTISYAILRWFAAVQDGLREM